MPPKRSITRQRQAKLSFSPVAASSSAAAGLSPQIRNRAAAVRLDSSPSRPAKKRRLVRSSESEGEIGLPTPRKSFQSNMLTPQKSEVERGMRLGMPVQTQRRGMFDSSEVEDIQSSNTSEAESEPAAKHKQKSSKKKQKKSSKNKKVLQIEDNSSGSDTMPDTTPPRRVRSTNRQQRQRSDSFEVPDNVLEVESSEDDVAPRSSRGHRRRPTYQEPESEGSDTEASAIRSPRKRLKRKTTQQEQNDLDEDLEFLRSSPPATQQRSKSKGMNQRQKALAALKRKRAAAEPSSSATPVRKRAVILSDASDADNTDVDSDLEVIEEDENEEEYEDEADDGEEEDGHQTNAFEVFEENEGDDDFIDDEANNDPIGEPADIQLPIQFSGVTRMKPRELFKYAVEWMVQKKINPAFSYDDEIYHYTFRKLNDEVLGLANSKFSSSAWTPDFTRALRSRPEITIDEIGQHLRAITMPHCEACNRRTHPATFNITFTGKPYHKETLEPLAEDSESSSDDDSDSAMSSNSEDERDQNGDKKTYDAQGELIPPESRVFTLGSTCKANAQVGHTLLHWRYHLNSWVVDYLVRTGYCTPEKLVERDSWTEKKRRKYANKIVDQMDKGGEIRKLYSLYKDQVNFAVEVSNEYRGRGRRH